MADDPFREQEFIERFARAFADAPLPLVALVWQDLEDFDKEVYIYVKFEEIVNLIPEEKRPSIVGLAPLGPPL